MGNDDEPKVIMLPLSIPFQYCSYMMGNKHKKGTYNRVFCNRQATTVCSIKKTI